MCNNTDVLRIEKEINEEGVDTGKIHGKICWMEKDETLYDQNEEKLELMKNEMSRNVSR